MEGEGDEGVVPESRRVWFRFIEEDVGVSATHESVSERCVETSIL